MKTYEIIIENEDTEARKTVRTFNKLDDAIDCYGHTLANIGKVARVTIDGEEVNHFWLYLYENDSRFEVPRLLGCEVFNKTTPLWEVEMF